MLTTQPVIWDFHFAPWRDAVSFASRSLYATKKSVVGQVGFEPTTHCLKGKCSAIELLTHTLIV